MNVAQIIQSLIVCLLCWQGYTTIVLQTSVARIEERLLSATDDRYRRSDAQRDFANAQEHRLELERRVAALERKLDGK